ncbi:GxGYxYP domain-containing protein [Calditrichota bacterium LG25]
MLFCKDFKKKSLTRTKGWIFFIFFLFSFFYGVSCPAQNTAYKIDVSGMGWEEKSLFSSVQGIVNKNGPFIFLRFDDIDDKWLQYYSSRYGFQFISLSDPYQLLTIFRDKIKGYVLWDYGNLESYNIAATLSGIHDWIVVSKYFEKKIETLGIPLKEDVSQKFIGMSKDQVYDWAFENYWDQCNKKYVTSLALGDIKWISVDITPYVNGTDFYVRFEDAIKTNGNGTKLRSLKIIQGGKEVVNLRTGTDEEKTYLYDADHSWFDPDGDRIADLTQYFTYRFQLSDSGQIILKFLAFNQYMVKVGNTPNGPFTTVSFSSKVTGSTIGGSRELDMAIFYRTFCFDLSSRKYDYPEEYAVKDKIMEAMEHPGFVLGWVSFQTGRDDEGSYVAQASLHGNAVICCGAPNFSFHHWVKPERFTPPSLSEPPAVDENKIYVSFLLSDGDAYHWTNGFQGRQYLSPDRGSIPFGWELQPLLYDMAPAVLQYYYETATDNDDLVASASGIGYCHPEKFPADRLDTYLQETRRYLELTGLKSISILSANNISFDVALKYRKYFKDLTVGCEEGYGGRTPGVFPFTDFSIIRTRVPMVGESDPEMILQELNELAQSTTQRPLFVPVHPTCYYTGFEGVKWITDHLDPEVFQVVKPSQLMTMVSRYYQGKLLIDAPKRLIPVLVNGALFLPFKLRAIVETPISVKINLTAPVGVKVTNYQQEVQAFQGTITRGEFRLTLNEPSLSSDILKAARLNLSSALTQDSLIIPMVALDYQAPDNWYCEYSANWDAIELNHRYGRQVEDDSAVHGTAWFTQKNAPEAPAHSIFGPYESMAAGEYVACFRLKVGELISSEVALLDVFNLNANKTTLCQKYIRGTDFNAKNKYQFFYLPFKHDGQGTIETRVYTTGAEDLWIDEIIILRQKEMGHIDGPAQGFVGDTLSFSVRAFSIDSDSVSVRFDWGDGDSSEWSDFQASGYLFTQTHAWADTGSFSIRFKTRNTGLNESEWSAPTVVTISATPVNIEANVSIPQDFALGQNYPNPFNPVTHIRFALPQVGRVVLNVYNIFGEKVKTLMNEVKTPGEYQVIWDGRNELNQNVASGIYFYQLIFDNKKLVKKMILIR